MMRLSLPKSAVPVLALGVLLATNAIHATAQVHLAPAQPVIGSSNTVSADPVIARPSTKHCVKTLFENMKFADFNAKSFSYAPPGSCPGPWSKVILTVDFTVTAGRQYDRTAQFYLGGANLFFGTTAEPRSRLSPFWHVESDVTDLTSLLSSAQTGSAILGNFVGVYNGVDYTGIIYATANLYFYDTDAKNPAPAVPSEIIGLPGNSGAANVGTSPSVYTQTVTLPTNVIGAYLDVIAQGQSQDEFWYFNVPDSLTTELQDYGGTGFRETEITIDGTPAGVAPVYPWIFTGGIDPYLWEPIPGVQTLNFKPFRVDLTPFAGLLSNGQTHTVGIQVFNAESYFNVAGNLLLYTDPYLSTVTGEVVSNSLTAEPIPELVNNIVVDGSGDVSGTLDIDYNRKYAIMGKVMTSWGPKTTIVQQDLGFKQIQTFTIDATKYIQDVDQSTTAYGSSITNLGGVYTTQINSYSYPFSVSYDFELNPDGTAFQTTKASLTDKVHVKQQLGYVSQDVTDTTNTVTSQDTWHLDSGFNITSLSGTESTQTYTSTDSTGACSSRTLTSAGRKLTSVVDGAGCKK